MAVEPLVWLNGTLIEASEPSSFHEFKTFLASDRAFHYGHGLFETIRVCGGKMSFLALHLKRLREGLCRLRLAEAEFLDNNFLPKLSHQINALTFPAVEGLLKLIVSAGYAKKGGYAGGQEQCFNTMLRWTPLSVSTNVVGVRIKKCDHHLPHQPFLAGLKHLNRLDQVICANEVKQAGFDEGLVCDATGTPIEATSSNLFIVLNDGQLVTPSLDLAGVAGVLRQAILTESGVSLPEVRVSGLSMQDVVLAKEVFLTNAVQGVRPVVLLQIDDQSYDYSVGPVFKQVRQWFEDALQSASFAK